MSLCDAEFHVLTWLNSACSVAQSWLTLCSSVDCSPPGSSVHELLQARTPEWLAMPSSRGSSPPRGRTRSSALQVDSLLIEPPEKPKNTGVGSLSLLQGNFPTQESKPGLLHCRQILYCLSYQGSPRILEWVAFAFSRGYS